MNRLSQEHLQLHLRELDNLGSAERVRAVSLGGRWAALRRCLHTRRALLLLSTEHLQDIGLSRAEALEEARRPVWRLLLSTLIGAEAGAQRLEPMPGLVHTRASPSWSGPAHELQQPENPSLARADSVLRVCAGVS